MSSGLYNTHKNDFDTTLDLTKLKPYGDTMNDGKVQLSFTLPIKDDARGEEAARQIAKKMGLEAPNVAYHKALDKEFTFYVVYGSCVHTINYDDIHVMTVESDVMTMEETNEFIQKNIGRKVVMVGASTGTDAHTVGIDAIMNRCKFHTFHNRRLLCSFGKPFRNTDNSKITKSPDCFFHTVKAVFCIITEIF